MQIDSNIVAGASTALVTVFIALFGLFWKQVSNDRQERRERDKALFDKIDGLKDGISAVRENFVQHNTCDQRRKDCPCNREMLDLKKQFHEHERDEIDLTKTQLLQIKKV